MRDRPSYIPPRGWEPGDYCPRDGDWGTCPIPPALAGDYPRLPRQRVEMLRAWLRLLRLCRRVPASVRPACVKGYVYLMWCPSVSLHRIGCSDQVGKKRLGQHKGRFDRQAEMLVRYYTPVDLVLLERATHRHFSNAHCRSHRRSKELFQLSPEEAAAFEAAVAAIERPLLAVEILRARHLLTLFEEDCRKWEGETPPPV